MTQVREVEFLGQTEWDSGSNRSLGDVGDTVMPDVLHVARRVCWDKPTVDFVIVPHSNGKRTGHMNTHVWTFRVGVTSFLRILLWTVWAVSGTGQLNYAPLLVPATDVQLHTVFGTGIRKEREDVLLSEIFVVAAENRREIEPVERTRGEMR
jgi:hypothetical protein